MIQFNYCNFFYHIKIQEYFKEELMLYKNIFANKLIRIQYESIIKLISICIVVI